MVDRPAHGGYPGTVVTDDPPERPRRFKSVPREVEAMRLQPGTDNYKDVCDWLHGSGVEVHHNGEGMVFFTSVTGPAQAGPGDWVVRSGGAGFYRVPDSQFRGSHDEVRDLPPLMHPWLQGPPSTLGQAMTLIGNYTESEGGDSDDTRQARANLFDAYEAWCHAGRPDT